MSDPMITLVIPVHNRAAIVERTLQSVECQTARPLRVILVDNNSTDNTLQVLRRWKAAAEAPGLEITVITEHTPGAAAARNAGLRLVSSEFVMFFDSDDIMHPTHVERALKAVGSTPPPDIAGWDVSITDLSGHRFTKPFDSRDCLWHCIMHGMMGTQRYVARTRLVRRAGEWNPAMTGWDDIELGLRMLLLNPRITKVKGTPTVDIIQQTESITGLDFSSSPAKWENALDEMESRLTSRRHRRYIALRRALLAGDYRREHAHDESNRLLNRVLGNERCPFYRTLYRLARAYTGAGGRGGARLLRPFF